MAASHQSDLILLTCASGKQCSQLIPLLYNKWTRLRLACNSAASEERLPQQWPKAEVIRAELADLHEVAQIMSDVTLVYHSRPSYHPYETEIAYYMIDTAIRESGHGAFKHFIFSSVLNTQLRKMMNHDCKRYAEEHFMESGLNYTILQPAHVMENIVALIGVLMSQDKPVFPATFSPKIPFSFLALADYAEAAAKVLEERDMHYFAQYPLCSTGPATYEEAVEMIGKEIRKPIEIKQQPFVTSVDMLLKRLTGSTKTHPMIRDAAERMLLFYNRHGLVGNSNVLQWLLGRKPKSHQAWIQEQVQKVRSK